MIDSQSKRISLDASVLASIFLKDRYYKDSSRAWSKIVSQNYNVVCPNTILAEVAGAIYRNIPQEARVLKEAIRFISAFQNESIVTFIDIDNHIIDEVLENAHTEKLRGMDSLYVAVASIYECSLLTLDKEQLKIGRVSTFQPSDFG